MKKKLLMLFSLIALGQANAQTGRYWSSHVENGTKIETAKGVARLSFPKEFKLFELNVDGIRTELFSIVGKNATKQTTIISIPNADGKLEEFQVYETSNFEADLQERFPQIRAFSGTGITDKYATLKLSIDHNGIQTMVFRTDKENEFIEAYSKDFKTYAVYKSQREKRDLAWSCSTEDRRLITDVNSQLPKTNKSSAGQLKTMRLAQSCTAEYSNYFGATSAAQVANVLAAFNATLTRCNGVYEKDLALHLNIVAASTNVIYYDPATDPYSAAATGSGGAWNTELQNTLSTSLTGPATSLAANNAAYDIGHLFGASGGGGNAGCIGCVCTDDTAATTDKNKGSGFTSPGDAIPQGDNFDIDYVTHEVGHQLGGNHTFTHSTENNAVNYEVGSGTTIMGYAGITARDTQAHSDDYYHASSIDQIQVNLAAKTCPTNTAITHGAPVVNAGPTYTIPKSTPFMLTGSATDIGGGSLTYCWEQYDEASAASMLCDDNPSTGALGDNDCIPVDTKTTGPVFRSYRPTASPTRYFPTMASVLAGSTTTMGVDITAEALPSVARTMNFRLTVRDNVAGQGQTGFGNTSVTVDATRGPLTVTSQNTDGITWIQGTSQTITWAVNGTNTSTGGANVDILLSTDNGATFSTVLVANTPNDGSQTITVPNIAAPYCRVMVKASGNIFFNVNVKNIAIGYIVTTTTTCTDYTRAFPSTAIPTGWTGFNLPVAPGVTDSYTISDANLKIIATAARTNQVSFGLVKPGSGTVDIVAFDGPTSGCNNSSANLNAVFDDEGVAFVCAAPATGAAYKPVGSLASIDGMNSAGQWVLAAKSSVAGNTLTSATLTLCHTDTTITLAIPEMEFQDFGLYPNPNKGSFTVSFTSQSTNDVVINVYDMRGRTVFTKSYENNGTFNQNVKLDNVQAGVYMVSILDGSKKTVKRIVVE